MLSPPQARARATVLAVEVSTLGVAAGTCIALALSALLRPGALALAPAAFAIAATSAWLGFGGATMSLRLGLGGALVGASRASAVTVAVAAGLLAAGATAAALVSRGWASANGATAMSGESVVVLALVAALGWATLATLARRQLDALDGSATPLADVLQPPAQGLLSGFGVVLLVGLIGGTISAELTYELGAAMAMAALWALASTARILRGIRRALRERRAEAAQLPQVAGAWRQAALTTLLGLFVPTLVIIADLASARLNGVVIAGFALIVVGHPLRYALAVCRLQDPFLRRSGRRPEPGVLDDDDDDDADPAGPQAGQPRSAPADGWSPSPWTDRP